MWLYLLKLLSKFCSYNVHWKSNLLCIGYGELLDDVIRHGPHDLYWCYWFERNVSSYKSIKTNQKWSEVTYCKYEARIAYKIARENIAQDNDNLYPPQRAVLEIHKQLLTFNFRPGLDKDTSIFKKYPILMQNL